MGFIDGVISPSGGGGGPVPSAAGLTALLALARADGASDGDVYQDSTSGGAFVFNSAGSGILLPTAWAGKVGALMSQDIASPANGPMYITLADATADVSGRGWVLTNATKIAGVPMEFDGSTPGAQYIVAGPSFTFAATDAIYMIARLKCTLAGTGSNFFTTRIPLIINGVRAWHVSYGTAAIGNVEVTNAPGNAIEGGSASNLSTGTAEGWLQFCYPAGNGSAIVSDVLDGSSACTIPYASIYTQASTTIHLFASGTGIFEIFECFIFEVL